MLFDLSPVPPEHPAGGRTGLRPRSRRTRSWRPRECKGLIRTPIEVAGRALGALGSPGRSIEQLREAAEGIGEIVWAGLNPAPDVPLNVPIGPHRRIWWVESRLADFKAIKDALGGTVNDVVLAIVAGALGRWLRGRGVRTEGLELRALVPVSIRSEDERGSLGNRIAAMRGPLPVYADDPIERLRLVRAGMSDLKESKQALGAEVIAGLTGFAPPTLLAQASRLNFSTRLFNLIVTNVPGPQFPLYILGREMESIVPIAFLPENHAMAVAIMSYNGKVHFGLLGDYDAMGDLEVFGRHLEDCLAELLKASKKKSAVRRREQRITQAGSEPQERHRPAQVGRQAGLRLAHRCGGRAMLGRQAARQLQRRLVQLGRHQLELARVLGQQRVPHLVPGDAGGLGRPRRRSWPDPSRGRAPRRRGASTSRTRAASLATTTTPTWAAPAIRRCPIPASLRSPRALTL